MKMFSMNTHLIKQAYLFLNMFGLMLLFDPGNRSRWRFITHGLHTHIHTHTEGGIFISTSHLHLLLLSFEVLHQLSWIGCFSCVMRSESEASCDKINTMWHRNVPYLGTPEWHVKEPQNLPKVIKPLRAVVVRCPWVELHHSQVGCQGSWSGQWCWLFVSEDGDGVPERPGHYASSSPASDVCPWHVLGVALWASAEETCLGGCTCWGLVEECRWAWLLHNCN